MTPPRDLADAQERLDGVGDYAQALHNLADAKRSDGQDHSAAIYDAIGWALERIIGGKP
jgi:hypothetical protein